MPQRSERPIKSDDVGHADDCPRDLLVAQLPALRAFAISLSRNVTLADDLVQDTVEKAWSRIDQFEPGTNMAAWLFTILRNTYYSHRRKMAREIPDVEGTHAAMLAIKPDHDGRLQLRDFYRAFARLPDQQRETLALLAGAGCSHKEAAAICGVAPGTIKSRANRGRRQLARLMHLDETGPNPMTDTVTMAIIANKLSA